MAYIVFVTDDSDVSAGLERLLRHLAGEVLPASTQGQNGSANVTAPLANTCHFGGPVNMPNVERWARLVLRIVESDTEPRTVALWAERAFVSTSALRNCCRAVGVRARDSLWFARVARSIIQGRSTGVLPDYLLDICDARTAMKVIKVSNGSGLQAGCLPSTIEEFLERQEWIPNGYAVRAVRELLSRRGCLSSND